MSGPGSKEPSKKFPDFVPPTKIQYVDRVPTLHLRRCSLAALDGDGGSHEFDQDEIRIGSMDDNDIVLRDETVSRYHCRIVQEDSGYVLVDQRSTNGTFVNRVRIREAYLRPGCTIGVGQSQLAFSAGEAAVAIVPSGADRLGDLIGANARMREIYAIIEKIAPTATTVVIEGETGTGKEVVAQTIHARSPRSRSGELVVFDCGAVPPNLIESELFGHEKGSFTGAVTTRQGLFEQADGGTLFLDELGELPLDLQPKLLRALEQREIRRVGSTRPMRVDVRIIAATNRTLEDEVREGRFRQDLFYRLSVVRLMLPALRERPDDIAALVEHFLRSHAFNRRADGGTRVRTVSDEALAALTAYAWPGNVRELVNVLERAVSFCEGGTIAFADLPAQVGSARPARGRAVSQNDAGRKPTRLARAGSPASAAAAPRPPEELTSGDVAFKDAKERWIASFEREYIGALLRRHAGNISHAARDADIDRKYFRKLMRKYGIEAADGLDVDVDD